MMMNKYPKYPKYPKCPTCGSSEEVYPVVDGEKRTYDCEGCSAFFTIPEKDDQEWDTGARRNNSSHKPRLDLISPHLLNRLGERMREGAENYGERNWEKGIPTSSFYVSACRHINDWLLDDSEDHLAGAVFNLMGIIHNQEEIKAGRMSPELDDAYRFCEPQQPETIAESLSKAVSELNKMQF